MSITIEQRLAKARAEAKALRAENAKLRATATQPEVEPEPEYQTEAQRNLLSAADALLGELNVVSWQRHLSGLVLGCALAYGAGWLVGLVLNIVMTAAAITTGSLAVVLFIYVLGVIAAAIAGAVIGTKAHDFVVSGKIDRVYESAKSKVLGIFAPKASFTGLFTKGAA